MEVELGLELERSRQKSGLTPVCGGFTTFDCCHRRSMDQRAGFQDHLMFDGKNSTARPHTAEETTADVEQTMDLSLWQERGRRTKMSSIP